MYYIVFGILYCISLLPFPVLYLLSYFFYCITYYVAGYRKATVFKNLAIAFPEKSLTERTIIAKQFYRHFWDNWLEAVKLMSISPTEMRKRVTANMAALEKIYASGSNCYVMLGHQFNWEWGNAFVKLQGYDLLCAYAPLSNKIFDRLLLYIRQRFGSYLVPFNDMRRAMLPYRHQQHVLALMADQSPPLPEKSYWLNFFNAQTAFLSGPEKGARLGNIPVVFVSISQQRRGYYHLEMILLSNDAGTTTEGELTKRYTGELEKSIRRSPALYLWSHNRWKHGWKAEYKKRWVDEKLEATEA